MNNSEKHKKWREANKEKEATRKKIYREENAEKLKEYRRKYREENKEKISLANKKYREENNERLKEYKQNNKQRQKEYGISSKEESYESWLRYAYSNCKLKHKRKSHIICEITLDDLIQKYEEQKGLCAISQVKLTHKQRSLNNISIDRKDNNIGYTKENIHLVAKWINIGRGTATLNQIKQAIKDLIDANKETVT